MLDDNPGDNARHPIMSVFVRSYDKCGCFYIFFVSQGMQNKKYWLLQWKPFRVYVWLDSTGRIWLHKETCLVMSQEFGNRDKQIFSIFLFCDSLCFPHCRNRCQIITFIETFVPHFIINQRILPKGCLQCAGTIVYSVLSFNTCFIRILVCRWVCFSGIIRSMHLRAFAYKLPYYHLIDMFQCYVWCSSKVRQYELLM